MALGSTHFFSSGGWALLMMKLVDGEDQNIFELSFVDIPIDLRVTLRFYNINVR